MKNARLFTDGAARGNPGPAGAGVVLMNGSGNVVFEGKRYLGETTNNQAEYMALSDGLVKALELKYSEIDISLDSELVVKQVRGEYKVKNAGLKPHFEKVKGLLKEFNYYSISYIPREKNKAADKLANKAIDEAMW